MFYVIYDSEGFGRVVYCNVVDVRNDVVRIEWRTEIFQKFSPAGVRNVGGPDRC